MGLIYTCDFCKTTIEKNENCVSFNIPHIKQQYDICEMCLKVIRVAVCKECHGKGTKSVRDEKATNAMATCGENRTQYKTVQCNCHN